MFKKKHYLYGDQSLAVPAHLNYGKYILDRFRLNSDEIAMENGDTNENLTFNDLAHYAVNLAVFLSNLGVTVGDTVAVGWEKRAELIPTMLGVILTGAAYTCYEFKSGLAVLRHQLSISKPKYFICSNLYWKTHKGVISAFDCIKKIITIDDNTDSTISVKLLYEKNVDLDLFEPASVQGQTDVAYIVYSSGTAGMTKGVQLTHLNCIIQTTISNDVFSTNKDKSIKTVFVTGDWYHSYSTFATFKALSVGQKVVYVDKATSFPKAIEEKQVEMAVIIPSLVELLSRCHEFDKLNLDSLQVLYSSSAPLQVGTIESLKKRLPNLKYFYQRYGLTETGMITSEYCGSKGSKPGSIGAVGPTCTVKVVDPKTHNVLGSNQRGEICIRSSALMKGYIGGDASNYFDDENFFKTGDLGYYDEDGYMFFVDRLKDTINTYAGDNIAPLDLEKILLCHPAVKEVVVVGKPVPDFGEEPMAFVVKQPGSDITEKELISYVSIEVPSYMELRGGVKFLDGLPKTARGKTSRLLLREMMHA